MKNIYWKGYCSKNRNQSITEIRNIINEYGFILDFNRFSDVAISMSAELEEQKVNKLYQKLQVVLDLDDFKEIEASSSRECTIFLNITFTRSKGDLKIETPAIPG